MPNIEVYEQLYPVRFLRQEIDVTRLAPVNGAAVPGATTKYKSIHRQRIRFAAKACTTKRVMASTAVSPALQVT